MSSLNKIEGALNAAQAATPYHGKINAMAHELYTQALAEIQKLRQAVDVEELRKDLMPCGGDIGVHRGDECFLFDFDVFRNEYELRSFPVDKWKSLRRHTKKLLEFIGEEDERLR